MGVGITAWLRVITMSNSFRNSQKVLDRGSNDVWLPGSRKSILTIWTRKTTALQKNRDDQWNALRTDETSCYHIIHGQLLLESRLRLGCYIGTRCGHIFIAIAVASPGEERERWRTAPGNTMQGVTPWWKSKNFSGWIYKEYWRNDHLEGGEGGSGDDD